MTLKERWLKVKAAFDGTPPPAPAPNPAPAPAAPSGMTSCSYNIDGGVPVYVNIADDGIPDIDMGDAVYSDTAMTVPYPDGIYKVTGTDFSFTVAGGLVTVVTDADNKGPGAPIESAMAKPPAPAPAPAAAAAPPQPVTLSTMTKEQITAIYSKFAGSVDDQIGALIVMVKALMECNFGWRIREGNENAAIEVYKDTLASTPTTITIEQMSSMFANAEKADEQAKIIARHEETIKQLLELTSQLVEMPSADPVTLTGGKKEKFERTQKKENAVLGIAAALKDIKKQN